MPLGVVIEWYFNPCLRLFHYTLLSDFELGMLSLSKCHQQNSRYFQGQCPSNKLNLQKE